MTTRYDIFVAAIASRDLVSVWLAVFVLALLIGWALVTRYARGKLAFMRTVYAGFVLTVWLAVWLASALVFW